MISADSAVKDVLIKTRCLYLYNVFSMSTVPGIQGNAMNHTSLAKVIPAHGMVHSYLYILDHKLL